jgi:hypothetical protein
MDIETKCNIIEEFMREHILHDTFDEEEVKNFIEYNNLGIPLAQGVSYKLANLTSEGENLLKETWDSLCFVLEVDSEGDYEDLQDLLDEDEEED